MAVSIVRDAPPAKATNITITPHSGLTTIYAYDSVADTFADKFSDYTDNAITNTLLSNVNDCLYLASYIYDTGYSDHTDGRFVHLHFDFDSSASEDLNLEIQYYASDGTWKDLPISNDETAGFTQNGSVLFDLSNDNYPSHLEWVKTSTDGTTTIGDGVERVYLRVKRTNANSLTAPVLKEIGSGYLTANKTYYYRMSSFAVTDFNSGRNRSEASNEFSATTTTIKRSVEISFDHSSPYHCIWRTPTSGDYAGAGYLYTRLSEIDTKCQKVNGKYFSDYSATQYDDNITIDNGIPLRVTNGSSVTYQSSSFKEFPQGTITVSGGTESTPATFKDILDKDIAESWNTFTTFTSNLSSNLYGYHIYKSYDNIIIEGVFKDTQCLIDIDGYIYTRDATDVQFGDNIEDSFSRGVTFIQTAEIHKSADWRFANAKFYNCHFYDNCLDDSDRNYMVIYFYENCELYETTFEAKRMWEGQYFVGANIIIENCLLSNERYGLEVGSDAIDSISISGLIVQSTGGLSGDRGMSVDSTPEGGTTDFKNFTFKNLDNIAIDYSEDPNKTFNYINPTRINCDFLTSFLGAGCKIYEKMETDITLYDENDPIEDVTIQLTDIHNNIISGTTDVNGKVSFEVPITLYETGSNVFSGNKYYTDVVTNFNPYTLRIEKQGYETYESTFDINQKTDLTITLKEAQEIVTTNKGMGIRIDPTNSTQDRNFIILP